MEMQSRVGYSSVQYAYVHADKEGRWHAYGKSACLFRLMLKASLATQSARLHSLKDVFNPTIDVVELEFSTLLNFDIALCSDTSLVIACPSELLGKAS